MYRLGVALTVLASCGSPAPPATFGERVVEAMEARINAPALSAALAQERASLVSALDRVVPRDAEDALEAYVTSDALVEVSEDGTLTNGIASLGLLLEEAADHDELLDTLVREQMRRGYRPARVAMGAIGPLTSSPHLHDALVQTLPTLVGGGEAHAAWMTLVAATSDALSAAAVPLDAGTPDRTGALVQSLLFTEYPELAEAQPLVMVRRDDRGDAIVIAPTDPMPAPFGDTGTRDDAGRAIDETGAPRYVYVDLGRTLFGALVHDASALFAQGAALDLVRGAATLLRGDAPLLDLVHAFAQLLRDPNIDDNLALLETLVVDHEAVTVRLLEAMIAAARMGDAHPEALVATNAPLWDDLVPILRRISADPQLVRALLAALQRPEVALLSERIRELATHRDRFDINDVTFVVEGALANAPDRTQPDSDDNRSLLQRLLHVLGDLNGSVECNKPLARMTDPVTQVTLATYNECQLYRIPNMTVFFLQSIAYARNATGQIICENAGGVFDASRTAATAEACAAHGAGWRGRPKADFNFQWGAFAAGMLDTFGGDGFLEDTAGIAGFRTHPTPAAVGRLLFQRRSSWLGDLSAPSKDKFGEPMRTKHAGTLAVLETTEFFAQVRPIVQAFADRDQEQILADLISVLHAHWSSVQSTSTQHADATAPNFTFGSNLVSFEPMLDEVLASDLWPALVESAGELDAITIDSKPFATLLANATQFVFTPLDGLADRHGRTTTTTSDGREVAMLAPFHLLADAELAKRATGGPWLTAVPALVDLWFRGQLTADGWRFRSRASSALLRGTLALVRERLAAHVDDRLAWLSTTLPANTQSTLAHPIVLALGGVLDAQTSRSLDELLADAFDPARADTFDTMRISIADLVQRASGDDLIPLAHVAGRLLASDRTYITDQLALAARLFAADTDGTLTGILQRWVVSRDAIVGSIGAVHRVEPGMLTPWTPADYAKILRRIGGFLYEERVTGYRGFVEIATSRTSRR